MLPRTVALAHYRERKRLIRAIRKHARTLWRRLDFAALDASWRSLSAELLVPLAGAQLAAARVADEYLDDVLDAQGVDSESVGSVAARALAGVSADGGELHLLLDQPVIATKVAIGEGATRSRALASGYATLDMIVRTEVADAGRVADQIALTARPAVHGYVRMTVGKTCARCLILAGKRYRWNTGFDRHPNCFPAGVVVSGPATLAASRRPYEGELVVIRTASGQELPATGNHPVLTDRGWLPANLIQEGDHVVRSTRSQGATALTVPDEDQMPARIEDCWRPDGVMPLLHVPTTTEDFHGDGGYGDVDVVLADRLLRNGSQSSVGELAKEEEFARRIAEALVLASPRAAEQLLHGLLGSAYGVVGCGGLGETLGRCHAAGAYAARAGHSAYLDFRAFQSPPDHVAGHPVAQAQAVLALSGEVRRHDLVDWQVDISPRWDAPAGSFTVESRMAYASRGHDLLFRLAGQVETDRVVEVRRVEWSGHVFNLTSSEGWYCANGLIVSNCDCVHIPASEDTANDLRTNPKAAFAAMDRAEQDRVFTKAGAEAIRDGADMNQVVNARKGLYTAGGRTFTTEATTRRGIAGKRLAAKRGGRAIRLMPKQIFREANGNREEALRLLRLHGYIL